MSEEKKHGLYKVVAQADKLARIVMDQLAKDGCGNLENIRDAMLPALVAIEREKEGARRGPWMGYDLARPGAIRRATREQAIDSFLAAKNPIYERFCDNLPPPVRTTIEQAVHEAMTGQLVAWETRPCGNRYAVPLTPQLRKAFAAAIATGGPMRVSISDGTYVMPDGEVLTELEMIKRSGTDGRRTREHDPHAHGRSARRQARPDVAR